MESPFIKENTDFTLFGFQHKLVLLAIAGLCIFLPWAARRWLKEKDQLLLARGMKLLLAFGVVSWISMRMYLGQFDATTDLPFDICNIVALLLPLLMWNPTQRVHEIMYFWIFAGTIQAVVTPHLYEGYPHFTFFKYWIVHGGLVIYAVYITAVFQLRPTRQSIFRAFGYLQGYAVFVLCVDLLLRANYMYLLGKPPTASPLDFLGPWPWYLLVSEGVALALFGLVYLPLTITRKKAMQ